MEIELAAGDSAFASRSDVRDGLHALELKIEGFRCELSGEIKGIIRWNFAFWVTQLVAITGILKLLR